MKLQPRGSHGAALWIAIPVLTFITSMGMAASTDSEMRRGLAASGGVHVDIGPRTVPPHDYTTQPPAWIEGTWVHNDGLGWRWLVIEQAGSRFDGRLGVNPPAPPLEPCGQPVLQGNVDGQELTFTLGLAGYGCPCSGTSDFARITAVFDSSTASMSGSFVNTCGITGVWEACYVGPTSVAASLGDQPAAVAGECPLPNEAPPPLPPLPIQTRTETIELLVGLAAIGAAVLMRRRAKTAG